MPRSNAPFTIRIVGRRSDVQRFVIRDARRPAEMFWSGKGWSRRIQDARLFADRDDVNRTIDRLTRRHLRRHHPKRLYLMTILVRVHADEDVSRCDIENYLKDSLVVGVDHERYGTGPAPDSLVEVVLPSVISLEGR